jgi:hypothetical protein
MSIASKRFVGRTVAALASLAVLAAGGCQSVDSPIQSITPNPPAEKIDNTPAIVDEATQIRSWPQTAAYYPDSETTAGNIGFWWEPKPGICQYESGVIETPLFFVNVCILPLSLVMVPPWHEVHWSPGNVPPTYSANPPLPPTKAGPSIEGEGLTPGPTTMK